MIGNYIVVETTHLSKVATELTEMALNNFYGYDQWDWDIAKDYCEMTHRPNGLSGGVSVLAVDGSDVLVIHPPQIIECNFFSGVMKLLVHYEMVEPTDVMGVSNELH